MRARPGCNRAGWDGPTRAEPSWRRARPRRSALGARTELIRPVGLSNQGGPEAALEDSRSPGLAGALGGSWSPTLARRFPVGLGDAPLPATTSTARTVTYQDRTTSFPWSLDHSDLLRTNERR